MATVCNFINVFFIFWRAKSDLVRVTFCPVGQTLVIPVIKEVIKRRSRKSKKVCGFSGGGSGGWMGRNCDHFTK